MKERSEKLKRGGERMNHPLNRDSRGIRQFRKWFDALTGGGFRALAKRRLKFLRGTRDRLDRGGLWALTRRLGTKSLSSDVSLATAANSSARPKNTMAESALEPESPPQQGTETSSGNSPNNQATRDQILLAPVARGAHIIEIGPSYNPIAPKAAGWNTKTLDHTTARH